jgi:hypothetical protein
MVYKQKHIDTPMSLLLDKRVRHRGRYAHYYFDKDRTSSKVFSNFRGTVSRHFYSADDRLVVVHHPANRDRHVSVCRTAGIASPRRVSSLLAGYSMGHASSAADTGRNAGSVVLPGWNDHTGIGRHPVSSQRLQGQRSRILAGCGSLDAETDCLCLGSESEDTFKNTKQLLGGQQPQTWKGKGPERAAGLSLWLYSVVWLWYLGQKSGHRYFIVQPWYPQKVTPSFADAIAFLRRCLWRERIKYMFGNSAVHDKKFEFLLEALAQAA